MAILLTASSISKMLPGVGRCILSNVNLKLHEGVTIAITGESGAGKSLLLQILGTLEPFSSGELEIMGSRTHANSHRIRNRHIGFVFQNFNLLEHYSTIDNILLPSLICGRKDVEYAQFLITRMGLGHVMDTSAEKLSGGEKQRTAIARALINRPKIILADEPTGNLDSKNSMQIADLLFETCQNENVALVIVTHSHGLMKRCEVQYELIKGMLRRI